MRRPRSTGALALASGLLSLALAAPAVAAPPTSTAGPAPARVATTVEPTTPLDRPEVGPGTSFVDVREKLDGYADPGWYAANVPVVDLPDADAEAVYYYRWRVLKEHLRYTEPGTGWVLTEFLDCCGYAAPYQAINAAAGHQLAEGRWLRDQRYLDDYEDYWLTGPGQIVAVDPLGMPAEGFPFGPLVAAGQGGGRLAVGLLVVEVHQADQIA